MPLVLTGISLLLFGAAGDLAYHLFGLATLVGDDGQRAHLITFAGMLISVTGLLVRATQTRQRVPTFPHRKKTKRCHSVPS